VWNEDVLNVEGGDEIRTAGEGVGGCEWEGGRVRKYPQEELSRGSMGRASGHHVAWSICIALAFIRKS